MGVFYWVHNIVLYSFVIYSIHQHRQTNKIIKCLIGKHRQSQHQLYETIKCIVELTNLGALSLDSFSELPDSTDN